MRYEGFRTTTLVCGVTASLGSWITQNPESLARRSRRANELETKTPAEGVSVTATVAAGFITSQMHFHIETKKRAVQSSRA